ncbi:hypothetical protein IMSAGC004_01446 [Bacteroidaceae bacterium]|nr:hypothetical protein IMSAGC004_01446 [Bacteroidaceae bacterium]
MKEQYNNVVKDTIRLIFLEKGLYKKQTIVFEYFKL